MSFGLGKIPGHSNTDFKHRKAFNIIKDWTSEKSNQSKNAPLFQKPHRSNRERKQTLLFRAFCIMIFSILVSGIYLYAKKLNVESKAIAAEMRAEVLRQKQKIKQQKEYDILIFSGDIHLQKNRLEEAQEKFIAAINLDSTQNQAYIGLTKTLVKKCFYLKENCKEAEAYMEYVEKRR